MKRLLFCGALAALAGCFGTTTPSRSQALTLDHCTVNIYGGGVDTNEMARIELATQAMSIENSGSETQTSSPTQTTDVKPDVDVSVTPKAAATPAVPAAGGTCGDTCEAK